MEAKGAVAVAEKPKPNRKFDTVIRLETKLVNKARFVAQSRGVPLAELLTEWLRPTVDREFAKEVKKTDDPGPKA